MLKVLQQEIRRSHARSQALQWVEELHLTETIGKGGFGMVYKGTYKGAAAAVKVMYARQHERQAMKDALEMAVLSTISHPNIIQVGGARGFRPRDWVEALHVLWRCCV